MSGHGVILLLYGLLFTTVAGANVIFPAFTAPYVSALLFPIALIGVLIIEGAIYKWRYRAMDLPTMLILVVLVNLVSWLVGIFITNFLPSGLITDSEGRVRSGPQFMLYAKLGFLTAYVLSVLIEGAALKLASRKLPMEGPWRLSLLANTASYLFLDLVVWAIM